ncbi:MAG: glycosyltransferase family 9 protein [Saprospiraceae bacterium]
MIKGLKKILFFSEGQIGDMILLTPALRAAKKAYPESEITVLLFHRRNYLDDNHFKESYITQSAKFTSSEVYYNNTDVDIVLEVNRNALRKMKGIERLKAEWSNICFLRNKNFNASIACFSEDRFLLWAFLARIKIRIGQRHRPLSYLLTRKIKYRIPEDNINVVKYFCELLRPLDIITKDYHTEFHTSVEDKQWVDDFINTNNLKGKTLIAVHPGSSEKDRRMVAEAYADIIDNINQREGFKALVCFSLYDINFINDVRLHIKSNIIEATPDSISKLGELFKKCTLCITNNSGPRHLAAAVGSRTISFLTKHDERNWGIYEDKSRHRYFTSLIPCKICPPNICRGLVPEGENFAAYCMRDIDIEFVKRNINEMLDNS